MGTPLTFAATILLAALAVPASAMDGTHKEPVLSGAMHKDGTKGDSMRSGTPAKQGTKNDSLSRDQDDKDAMKR